MPLYGQVPVAYRAVFLAAGLLVFGLLFQQLVTLLVAILVTVLIALPLTVVADRLEARGVPRASGPSPALFLGVGTLAAGPRPRDPAVHGPGGGVRRDGPRDGRGPRASSPATWSARTRQRSETASRSS